jgi:predicted transcriptional regulator
VNEIIATNSVFYEETYRALPSGQQKALLLLSYGKKEVYSTELLQKFGVTSSQALQKALNSLIKKEVVDKNGNYYILDVFLQQWLYQTVLNQLV